MYRILVTLIASCFMMSAGCVQDDDDVNVAGNGGFIGEGGGDGEGGEAGDAGSAGEGGEAGDDGSAGEGGEAGDDGSAGEGGEAGDAGSAGEGGQGGDTPLTCTDTDCGDVVPAIGCATGDPILTCAPNSDETACEWNVACPEPDPECASGDKDEDNICNAEDPYCNLDDLQLACRRAEPPCSRGTVPEVIDGCFTDRCVTWDECRSSDPVPMVCGGILGAVCPEGQFCQFAVEAMCGEGDMQGVCVPHEPVGPCTRELRWVCGCDGNEYGNPCEAERGGTSIAYFGRCEDEPRICGTRGAQQCNEDEYCRFEPEANCGRTDMPGLCTSVPLEPTICTRDYAPVCGCDGVTYSNACQADAAAASVDYTGECVPPSCGGFVGNQCPDGLDCVDDPTDTCDPTAGGADCPGLCRAPAESCTNNDDCESGQWCRRAVDGSSECRDFADEGARCGGSTTPGTQERCDPTIHHCAFAQLMNGPNDEPLVGASGICAPYCQGNDECTVSGQFCMIEPPCLSPAGNLTDVCYGYCWSAL